MSAGSGGGGFRPAPRPSVVLWDWDNTLVDAWAGIAAAMNAALGTFGLPPWTVHQTRARARLSLREAFPALFGPDWQRARDVFYQVLSAGHLAHVAPMPGAAAALEAAAIWPQGVVSNKNPEYLRAGATHLGWHARFGAIIGAGDAAADKPAAAPILLALSRLGLPAGREVWYAGDTATDMLAARAAGVTAVLVGDAADDGGVAAADPDLQFSDAYSLAERLRMLA